MLNLIAKQVKRWVGIEEKIVLSMLWQASK
jgi:hypothetical protein